MDIGKPSKEVKILFGILSINSLIQTTPQSTIILETIF